MQFIVRECNGSSYLRGDGKAQHTSKMIQPGQARVGGRIESQTVGDGIRAAMYGEMTAAAAGSRPWWGGKTDWDAALVGAIHFVERSEFDAISSRCLLSEAAQLRMAGDLYGWETPAAAVCARLADEFRRLVARP